MNFHRRGLDGAMALANFGATLLSRQASASAIVRFKGALSIVQEIGKSQISSDELNCNNQCVLEHIEQELTLAISDLIKTPPRPQEHCLEEVTASEECCCHFIDKTFAHSMSHIIELSLDYFSQEAIEVCQRKAGHEASLTIFPTNQNVDSSSSRKHLGKCCILNFDISSFDSLDEDIVTAIILHNLGMAYMCRAQEIELGAAHKSKCAPPTVVEFRKKSKNLLKLSVSFLEDRLERESIEDKPILLQVLTTNLIVTSSIIDIATLLHDSQEAEAYEIKRTELEKSTKAHLNSFKLFDILFRRTAAAA